MVLLASVSLLVSSRRPFSLNTVVSGLVWYFHGGIPSGTNSLCKCTLTDKPLAVRLTVFALAVWNVHTLSIIASKLPSVEGAFDAAAFDNASSG